MKATHKWLFDLPWHMVDLRDWFYMVNYGYISPAFYFHVRVLGLRSLWTIIISERETETKLARDLLR